jgi:hypothetical protein
MAVAFIEELCEKMIAEKNKVFRAGNLLAMVR